MCAEGQSSIQCNHRIVLLPLLPCSLKHNAKLIKHAHTARWKLLLKSSATQLWWCTETVLALFGAGLNCRARMKVARRKEHSATRLSIHCLLRVWFTLAVPSVASSYCNTGSHCLYVRNADQCDCKLLYRSVLEHLHCCTLQCAYAMLFAMCWMWRSQYSGGCQQAWHSSIWAPDTAATAVSRWHVNEKKVQGWLSLDAGCFIHINVIWRFKQAIYLSSNARWCAALNIQRNERLYGSVCRHTVWACIAICTAIVPSSCISR